MMGIEIKIKQEEQRIRPEESEVMRLVCDNSLIKSLSNWKPKYDLISGLEITIEWIKENIDNYKSEIYNV